MIEQKTSATATRATFVVAVALLSVFAAFADSARAETKRVVAVGDIACPASRPVTATTCRHAAVADRVAALKPDSLFIPGDVQYPAASLADLNSSFEVSWGRFSKIWRPAPGNHEYYTAGAAGYYDFFGDAAGPNRRGYYSFNIGDWHVVSLNTNCDVIGCGFNSAQNRWLRRDLARNRKQCVAAIAHHPLISSGYHGPSPMVRPLFKELRKARADLVLAGHEHSYERFAPVTELGRASARNGVTTIVVGTGGYSHYGFNPLLPPSRKAITGHFGALDLRLRERSYSWRFVNEFGSVLDRGKARCR